MYIILFFNIHASNDVYSEYTSDTLPVTNYNYKDSRSDNVITNQIGKFSLCLIHIYHELIKFWNRKINYIRFLF